MRTGVVLAGVCIGAAVAAIAWQLRTSHDPPRTGIEKPASRIESLDQSTSLSQPTPRRSPPASTGAPATGADYRAGFAHATSYWKFANDLLTAANEDDADAQYYLARTLATCKEMNTSYFVRRGRQLTLEEALHDAARLKIPLTLIQDAYDKCHEFTQHDTSTLGTDTQWLTRATAGGQPIAVATTATKKLQQTAQEDAAKATGVDNPAPHDASLDSVDSIKMLRTAVRSGNPDVLFLVGDAVGMMPSDGDSSVDRFAWQLLACQRGADCTANSDWIRRSCEWDPQCISAVNPEDYLRSQAGDDWPAVQQRAGNIGAQLDAGDWDNLPIGPAPKN